jgi:NADPH-dependent curcumin reductase CurA
VQGYFSGSFEPGKPLESGGVAVVKASKGGRFKEAEVVTGLLPWASHIVLDSKQQVRSSS